MKYSETEKLEKLIKKGESKNLEFKESLSLKEDIGKCVSAFCNCCDGRILVGVSDGGVIKGIEIGKKTIEQLANYIKQNTDASVYVNIEVERIEGKEIIVIGVKECDEKPVFFRGNCYVRVGKSSHKLSASEIRKMVKESVKVHWDGQVCEGASLEDLDFDFVGKFFRPKYDLITGIELVGKDKELLESLNCIKNNKPTNAGILLFGKEPQKFFMNSYIALARYKEGIGTERLDYKEFKGNLFQQIDKCDAYIKENIAIMSKQDPYKVQREDIPEYGLFSIRELITNAVCHRDYLEQGSKVIIKMFKDRIDYYNVGGLHRGINSGNIERRQFSRNPTLAKVLAKIRYIEDMGEGWDKIIKEHRKHSLKPQMPEIDSDESGISVSLFSSKEKFEKNVPVNVPVNVPANYRQKWIIDKILKEGKIRFPEILKNFSGVAEKTIKRDLKYLREKKFIKFVGASKTGYYCFDNFLDNKRRLK